MNIENFNFANINNPRTQINNNFNEQKIMEYCHNNYQTILPNKLQYDTFEQQSAAVFPIDMEHIIEILEQLDIVI
jgi:hypothetical protein